DADARRLRAHTGEEFSVAAMITIAAVAAVPSHADALAQLPRGDSGPNRVDHSGHFVPWNARVLNTGKEPFLGEGITVANAAGLNLYPHGPWSRVGDRALDELEGPAGARDLGDTHRGLEDVHIGLLSCYAWCYGLVGITDCSAGEWSPA